MKALFKDFGDFIIFIGLMLLTGFGVFPILEEIKNGFTMQDVIPFVLLAVLTFIGLLVLFGFFIYWIFLCSGNDEKESNKPQKLNIRDNFATTVTDKREASSQLNLQKERYCTNCGRKLQESDLYCGHCGKRIECKHSDKEGL